MEISISKEHLIKSGLSSSLFEFNYRSSLQGKDSTHRMVSEQSGPESNIQLFQKNNDRSTRFEIESQSLHLLFLDSRSESTINRLIVNFRETR